MQLQARDRQGGAGLSPPPQGLGEGLYLLLIADVPGGGSPGDGGDGVPRGLAGQRDLILQLHGCLVLHVGDFGFGWGGGEQGTFAQVGLRVKPFCHQQGLESLGRTGTINARREGAEWLLPGHLLAEVKDLKILSSFPQLRLLRGDPFRNVQTQPLGSPAPSSTPLSQISPWLSSFVRGCTAGRESQIPEHLQIPGRQESP